MTAIELLKQDHDEAMMMIERLERVEQGAQLRGSNLALFGRLKSALTMHTLVEEQILYHSLANLEETKELIKGSYDGHRTVGYWQPRGTWAEWRRLGVHYLVDTSYLDEKPATLAEGQFETVHRSATLNLRVLDLHRIYEPH